MLRAMLLCVLAHASCFQLPATGVTSAKFSCPPAVAMREKDSRSKSREALLPDILKALDEVSVFISKADASRQRKPEAPSADCIEAYCANQQRKVDLLLAEAKKLREAEAEGIEKEGPVVRWTDIDGHDNNDAVWLK